MKIPDQGLWTADTEDVWLEMKGEEFSIRAIEPGWYGTMRRVRLNRDIYDDPMDRKERLEVMFTTIAVHEMDFTSLNYYLSHAEKSLFRCQRIVNLRTERGYRALTGLVYRALTDGEIIDKEYLPQDPTDPNLIMYMPFNTVENNEMKEQIGRAHV